MSGIAEHDRLAVDNDSSTRIGRIGARQDLHQRRFAGTVFTHQRMDFAGVNREADARKRLGDAKGLADVAHFQKRARRCRRGCHARASFFAERGSAIRLRQVLR